MAKKGAALHRVPHHMRVKVKTAERVAPRAALQLGITTEAANAHAISVQDEQGNIKQHLTRDCSGWPAKRRPLTRKHKAKKLPKTSRRAKRKFAPERRQRKESQLKGRRCEKYRESASNHGLIVESAIYPASRTAAPQSPLKNGLPCKVKNSLKRQPLKNSSFCRLLKAAQSSKTHDPALP